MKILPISDIHLECFNTNYKPFFNSLSPADVLILAGDIAPVRQPWFEDIVKYCCDLYPKVIHTLGNHEYWGSSAEEVDHKLNFLQENYTNYHVLDKNTITIDNITFAGATTWFPDTPDTRLFQMYMNDFKHIKEFVPWVYEENEKSIEFWETVEADIWISHHIPVSSVSNRYKGNKMNCYFVDPALDGLIAYKQPNFFICGHSHDSCDYYINRTRIIRNPYGYETLDGRNLNKEFNYNLVVEL